MCQLKRFIKRRIDFHCLLYEHANHCRLFFFESKQTGIKYAVISSNVSRQTVLLINLSGTQSHTKLGSVGCHDAYSYHEPFYYGGTFLALFTLTIRLTKIRKLDLKALRTLIRILMHLIGLSSSFESGKYVI